MLAPDRLAQPKGFADRRTVDEIRKFDTPVVSIGGAGTFDGIVVSGMVALLLA